MKHVPYNSHPVGVFFKYMTCDGIKSVKTIDPPTLAALPSFLLLA
jgi:hypothetical protein